MYQLPSSHLFIHRVPAKLSNRVMPYGENFCQLQLLFVLILLTYSLFKVLIISGRFTLLRSVDHVVDAVFLLHHYRISFQNPARFQNTLEPSKVLDLCFYQSSSFTYAASTSCLLGRLMSINIFFGSYLTPLVRMVYITLSTLQAMTISDCIFFSGFSDLVV